MVKFLIMPVANGPQFCHKCGANPLPLAYRVFHQPPQIIEVADLMWPSKTEIEDMIRQGNFFEDCYITTLPE